MKKETIAAISTGMSNSGIGIVRISGEEAFEIADRIFRGKRKLSQCKTHTIQYGYIWDGEEAVDQVLVMVMRAPHTFTGEDTIEIDCHGGTFVVRRVLEAVLKNGARPAEPGEFTKRAFLNGKMDLSQAEAVIDVITSQNDYALKSSLSQLKGSLKKRICDIRNRILYHTAYIESALDDPEHITLDGYAEQLKKEAEIILAEIRQLIDSADDGRIIKEGIQTVIIGKPNAGKSSLLNVLTGYDRAIVTDIEGTTRDVLEEQISLHGLNLNIIDTAGIRETDDIIERMGVDKAEKYAENADLLICVVDASRQLDENDDRILQFTFYKKSIILLNKTDLEMAVNVEDIVNKLITLWKTRKNFLNLEKMPKIPVIMISAKEEKGIREFEEKVRELFLRGDISFNDEVFITNARQKSDLNDAVESMEKVLKSIDDGMPEDFYSIDLMDAYEALGRITGEAVGEDLINEIFSRFCMGK